MKFEPKNKFDKIQTANRQEFESKMDQTQLTLRKEKIKKLLPKLKCAFHQNESLTNFCSCTKCLLPLCPTCIKIHTIEHVNMKTDPEYDNLFDVLFNLNLEVKDYLETYEDNHCALTEVQRKIQQYKDQVFANIQNLKKSIIDEVEKYFNQMLLSTDQQILQMKYLQDLDKHKAEIKKSTFALKKFDKMMLDDNITGKVVIRSLIKYSSKNTDEALENFDSQCKTLFSKLQSNFCIFSLKDNVKNSLHDFLGQIFMVKVNPIPTLQKKQSEQILGISKKLQEFTADIKTTQKSDIKNTLTKVMSKINQTQLSSNSMNFNSLQPQLSSTISEQKKAKNKQNDQGQKSEVSWKIFDSSGKRSFMNHSSQRKSLNISRGCGEQDNSMFQSSVKNSEINYESVGGRQRSMSRGKGLSLIQPRHSISESSKKSLNVTQQIRFSLAEIQNVNFDFDISKVSYINRRK